MMTDKTVPITPESNPKIKYKDPMSLWLVENSQRSHHLVNVVIMRITRLSPVMHP